jgi:hypothetical protein
MPVLLYVLGSLASLIGGYLIYLTGGWHQLTVGTILLVLAGLLISAAYIGRWVLSLQGR